MTDVGEGLGLGIDDLLQVAVARLRVGAAELVEADLFAGHFLDDVGTGDKEIALVTHRDEQVVLDRGVDRATGALTEDQRDLGNHTGERLVPTTQFGVPGQ